MIIALVVLWSRPDAPAVGQREFLMCQEQEALLVSASVGGTFDFDCSGIWLSSDRIPGRYVLGLKKGDIGLAVAWVEQQGGSVLRVDEAGDFLVATFPLNVDGNALLVSSVHEPIIRYLEPDLRVRAARIPNDPFFLSHQWDKWVMYADQAWDLAGAGRVKVGIVDNGVDYNHPDLVASFTPGEPGYDFVNNDNDPRPDNANVPNAFHGTHVAGIAAAVVDNGTGIAGWTHAQLLAVRVLDDSGNGNTSDLASGIRWAADRGCRVINMSLGSSSAPTPLIEACRYAAGRNVLLVAASGNEGNASINHPAALAECIAVGSLSPDSRLSTFSNRGPEQELIAPGEDIPSAVPGGNYALADGTSMASPQVAGVAALVLSLDTTMTTARLRAILAAAAIDMGSTGRDQTFGFGLLNARRALELAGALLDEKGGRKSTAPVSHALTVDTRWYDVLGRRVEPARLQTGAYFVRDRGITYRRFVVR